MTETEKIGVAPVYGHSNGVHRWTSSLRDAEEGKPTESRKSRKDKQSTGNERQENHFNAEEMPEIGNQTVRSPLKSKSPSEEQHIEVIDSGAKAAMNLGK